MCDDVLALEREDMRLAQGRDNEMRVGPKVGNW